MRDKIRIPRDVLISAKRKQIKLYEQYRIKKTLFQIILEDYKDNKEYEFKGFKI